MNILKAQQFDKPFLNELFSAAYLMKLTNKIPELPIERPVMASLFYEPSTRTRFSFEAAMIKLGGSVLSTENAEQFSSAAKGEILEDTIRVVSEYSDVIVMKYGCLVCSRTVLARWGGSAAGASHSHLR